MPCNVGQPKQAKISNSESNPSIHHQLVSAQPRSDSQVTLLEPGRIFSGRLLASPGFALFRYVAAHTAASMEQNLPTEVDTLIVGMSYLGAPAEITPS